MTDQTCPLCGKEMYYDSDGELYECQNQACFLYGKELFDDELEVLDSQIYRIKQEAKREVLDEFDTWRIMQELKVAESMEEHDIITVDLSFRRGKCRAYQISKEKLEEIKKKHGVE